MCALPISDRGEDALAEAERQTGGEGADEEGADRSGAGVVGPQPDRHTGEEGECVNGQGEEQPAEEADAGDGQEDSESDQDRKSTRLNSSHSCAYRMPSSALKTTNKDNNH